MVLHTFGRDLKFNPHIHTLITRGGLSIDKSKWISCSFIPHQALKSIWHYQIINTLRTLSKK
ncbi:MAG: transposase [Candidatus Omnitrophica bacterium]|nr:transposase [Candidatus Omnitrophota bacterium]